MILYNVTVKVEHNSHAEWLSWMQKAHIPKILQTGLVQSYRMSRLLGVDDSEGPTYSIQYVLDSMADYEHYQARFAPTLKKEHEDKYKNKALSFRTIMQLISQK